MENEKKHSVFISYGHDFTDEAKAFARTLTEAGYTVWIDYEGITPGSDWREKITEAIISCDCFVALLSAYGLREGGVCLDELAIALSRNRTNIRPVALEKGVEKLAPSAIAAIQFFDMSDWRTVPEAEKESWYAGKIRSFLDDCLLRPAQYEQKLTSIKARLRFPESFSREKFDIGKKFRKREWLDGEIRRWLEDDTRNVCLLEGFPGFGKSFYCSNFYHYAAKTCGLIYCDKYADKPDGVLKLIKEVSFAFAVRIPAFATRLDALLNSPAASGTFATADDAFDFFIAAPLNVIDGNMEEAVAVIDGVDFFYRNGENEALDVFCRCAARLPRFARFLLTARSAAVHTGGTEGVYRIAISPEDAKVYADIKGYLKETFDEVVPDRAESDRKSDAVAKRAQGSFLYASAVCEGIRSGRIAVDDAEALPGKVADVYYTWMKQLVSPQEYAERYADVLSVLVALENPPVDLIKNALGLKKATVYEILRNLSVLLLKNTDKLGNICVSFYCDSFAEWIGDEKNASSYAAYEEDGIAAVSDYLAEALEDEELTEYDILKAVSVLRKAGKKKRLAAFAQSEVFFESALALARKWQGNPDFYEEWNEILDGLAYLAGSCGAGAKAAARVLCCRAGGEFVCGNLVGCGRLLTENRALLDAHLTGRERLDCLYMLGTAADCNGEREASLAAFEKLKEEAEDRYPDYYVRAMAGIIWNDHFNNLSNGLANLARINARECGQDIAVQAALVTARILLSDGRMEDALAIYGRVLEEDAESLWKYDIVARKNQMLAIEAIVAAYDAGQYALARRYGALLYDRLQHVGGIPACYCLSWESLACHRAGDNARADELLAAAEKTFAQSCGDSLWLKAHLLSIRAKYLRRDGDTAGSVALEKEVEVLAEKTGDTWVRGDACFSIIAAGYLSGLETDPDGRYRQTLASLAAASGLPHLKYKAALTEFLFSPRDVEAEGRFAEVPSLASVNPEEIRALLAKKKNETGKED